MPSDVREERDAHFFRQVNERIYALEGGWVSGEPIGFICECSDPACIAPVYLTVGEFSDVRSSPRHFVARPGHVDWTNERVVTSTERYVVVSAGRVNPRGRLVVIPHRRTHR
jgi:hypothetical protein